MKEDKEERLLSRRWSEEEGEEGGQNRKKIEAGIASSRSDTRLRVCGVFASTRIHIGEDKKSQSVIVGTLLKGLFNKRNAPKTIKIIIILIGHHVEEAV